MKISDKTFVLLDSVKNPILWNNYQQGLKSALVRFGVEKVALSSVVKHNSIDTYAILSQDAETGVALGGIRLEVKSINNILPLEKIESTYREIILKKITNQANQNGKLAEICGLWVSAEANGRGMGAELALQATQLGVKLNINILVSMLPAHTLDYFLRLGFVVDQDLPKLAYPDDRYLSTIVWYYVPNVEIIKNKQDIQV